ncbi:MULTISPECIES: flagellar assembly peptidoglycan hydrolase FlgJ [unclassified Herbaspirillum]|uniref:flagellar assembly peptidoglycan hydrolase FlgJ n=1 Tax=unclassified Herbaspirillum TaxID=2624150 RepID=UPI000E2EEA29|nr:MULTISPECIES: flagellar assembly peptidoglycan hydrolase FlgJ [unclassified Herbaspirillum]RFB68714.1 flagellar assembly peptidoglycan hydrolase FlgJ [Herbaspirillum sp. 3R-3a1]TFI05622.1 flagellar assembly peptidoglycan hydrolase FlgJ [Herbaspirillum sp. 3R11]TFI13468.1 flagellar assembly peptidoglycan hydrolase FlgJ [Herbaspirillum sp. 3R-11]TFI27510.1 flagellar assembly peptidoglycan hydrolase FlgJ [Herbaspirillum sp. 3C11]
MINNIKPGNPTESLAADANSLNSLRSAAATQSPESLKGAAKQFEALFLNMMLKSMRDATPQDGMFDSPQTKMFTSMLDQQLSQNMAQRGVGLADMLVRQLSSSLNKPLPTDEDGASALPLDIPLANTLSDLDKSRLVQGLANAAVYDSTSSQGGNKRKGGQQRPAHVEAFQNRLQADAEAASRVTGIPAKFMLAQAALETGWGKKEIRARDGSSAHNLFGIKATGNWTGKTVDATTIEYVNGVAQRKVEKFRAYDSYSEAFQDYAKLLRSNPRYEKVLANAQDAHGFAYGLQRAGYATDPHYAEKLSRIIRQSLSV